MAQLPAITTRGKRIGEIINDYQPPYDPTTIPQFVNPLRANLTQGPGVDLLRQLSGQPPITSLLPPGSNALTTDQPAPPIPPASDFYQRALEMDPYLSKTPVDIGPLQQEMERQRIAEAGTEPGNLGQLRAQQQAKAADYQAQLDFLRQNPQQMATWNQMQVPQMPQAQYPTPPERQTPQMNPLVTLLAGLGAAISPQHAGQFLGQAVQGTVNTGQQGYEDQQRLYQQRLQQLQAEHHDALEKWNTQVRFIEENTAGQQRADLLNIAAREKRLIESGALTGGLAGETALGGAYAPGGPVAQGFQKEATEKAKLQNAIDELNSALRTNSGIQAAKINLVDQMGKMEVAGIGANARVTQTIIGGQNQFATQGLRNTGAMERTRATLTSKETIAAENNATRAAVGAAHDAARLKIAADKRAAGGDQIAVRAIINSQLNAFKGQLHDAKKAVADFDNKHPLSERMNDEDLRAQMGGLLRDRATLQGYFDRYNKEADALKTFTKGQALQGGVITGNGWSLTPK